MWALIICAGISWGGCGTFHQAEFPTQEACERALSTVRFDTPPGSTSGRSAFAYCRLGKITQ